MPFEAWFEEFLMYVEHGVKYKESTRTFVSRDVSAAHSIAWQARYMANTTNKATLQLQYGGKLHDQCTSR